MKMKEYKDYNFIFTASNNDPGGEKLNSAIKKNVKIYDNFYFYDSLGSQLYYSLLHSCDGLIGNSSNVALLKALCFKNSHSTLEAGKKEGKKQDIRLIAE